MAASSETTICTYGDVSAPAGRKSKYAEIRVQDRGEGISPEKLKHVFDRFYRGEESLTIPGFGLGLPIAQAREKQMESEVGKGGVVVILFPCVTNTA